MIVSIQRRSSAVSTATTRSRSSPSNPLPAKIAQLGALGVRVNLDLALLRALRPAALLALGARLEEVAHPHAEPVGDQVCDAHDHDDRVAQVRAGRPRDDGERRDRSVDRPVHRIA